MDAIPKPGRAETTGLKTKNGFIDALSLFMIDPKVKKDVFLTIFDEIYDYIDSVVAYPESTDENRERSALLNHYGLVQELRRTLHHYETIYKLIRTDLDDVDDYKTNAFDKKMALQKAIARIAFQLTVAFMDTHVVRANVPTTLADAVYFTASFLMDADEERDFFNNKSEYSQYAAKSGVDNGVMPKKSDQNYKESEYVTYSQYDTVERLRYVFNEHMLTTLLSNVTPIFGGMQTDIFTGKSSQLTPFVSEKLTIFDHNIVNHGGDGATVPLDIKYNSKLGPIDNRVFVKYSVIQCLYTVKYSEAMLSIGRRMTTSKFENALDYGLNPDVLKNIVNVNVLIATTRGLFGVNITHQSTCFKHIYDHADSVVSDLKIVYESKPDNVYQNISKGLRDAMRSNLSIKGYHASIALNNVDIDRIVAEYAIGKYIASTSNVSHRYFSQFVKMPFTNATYSQMHHLEKNLSETASRLYSNTAKKKSNILKIHKGILEEYSDKKRLDTDTNADLFFVSYDKDSETIYDALCTTLFSGVYRIFNEHVMNPNEGYVRFDTFPKSMDTKNLVSHEWLYPPFFNATVLGQNIVDEPVPMLVLNNASSDVPNKEDLKSDGYSVTDVYHLLMKTGKDTKKTQYYNITIKPFKTDAVRFGYLSCDLIVQWSDAMGPLYTDVNLTHNDTHGGNILVEQSESRVLTRVNTPTHSYESRNRIKIIDMGRCSFQFERSTENNQSKLSNYKVSSGIIYRTHVDDLKKNANGDRNKDYDDIIFPKIKDVLDHFSERSASSQFETNIIDYYTFRTAILKIYTKADGSFERSSLTFEETSLNIVLQKVVEPIRTHESFSDNYRSTPALNTNAFTDILYTLYLNVFRNLSQTTKFITKVAHFSNGLDTSATHKKVLTIAKSILIEETDPYGGVASWIYAPEVIISHGSLETHLETEFSDNFGKIHQINDSSSSSASSYDSDTDGNLGSDEDIFDHIKELITRTCVSLKILAHAMGFIATASLKQPIYKNTIAKKTYLSILLILTNASPGNMFDYNAMFERTRFNQVQLFVVDANSQPSLDDLKSYFVKTMYHSVSAHSRTPDEIGLNINDIDPADESTITPNPYKNDKYTEEYESYFKNVNDDIASEYREFSEKLVSDTLKTSSVSSYVDASSAIMESPYHQSSDARISTRSTDLKKPDMIVKDGEEYVGNLITKYNDIIVNLFAGDVFTQLVDFKRMMIRLDDIIKPLGITSSQRSEMLPTSIDAAFGETTAVDRIIADVMVNMSRILDRKNNATPDASASTAISKIAGERYGSMGDVIAKILTEKVTWANETSTEVTETTLEAMLVYSHDVKTTVIQLFSEYKKMVIPFNVTVSKLKHVFDLVKYLRGHYKFDTSTRSETETYMSWMIYAVVWCRNVLKYARAASERITSQIQHCIDSAIASVLRRYGYTYIIEHDGTYSRTDEFIVYFNKMINFNARFLDQVSIMFVELITIAFRNIAVLKFMLK